MEIPAFELVGAVIVSGVVQAIKTATSMPSRYAPLASLAIGIAAGLLWASSEGGGLIVGVIAGIIAGLAASGLYSGQKALRESDTHAEPNESPSR